MTPERLTALAEAYGADPQRWPPVERAAAKSLAAGGNPTLATVMAEAAALDALLARHTLPGPSARLLHAVEAAAAARRHLPNDRLRRAWAGLGLAGLGLAGALAGALAVAAVLPVEDAGAADPGGAGWMAPGTLFSTPAESSEP